MKVVSVPLLEDNYGYLLIHEPSRLAAVIDPAEPEKILKAAEEEGVTITTLLATHKHWDHSGGNSKLAKLVPGVSVLGGKTEHVEACTRLVEDGDVLTIAGEEGGIQVKCLHTPGHTMGHICYYAVEGDQNAVFTGDTLFVGGVGKFFEGTGDVVYPSLTKLSELPPDTKVYCGHEYTLSNYKFASKIDPDNEELKAAVAWAERQRINGHFTIPSTIAKELVTNPFLRVNNAAIRAKTGLGDDATPAQTLQRLRDMKDGL